MIVWTIANQKGGVGKTTTTVTLGGLIAEQGKRVLLVDVDPHGSMTSYFGYDPDALTKSAYQFFQNEEQLNAHTVEEVVLPTKQEGVFLIPASMALATLDHQLSQDAGDYKGLVLAKALAALDERYDVALIDCPPIMGVLMVNALAACKHVVVPTQTEFLALQGLDRMVTSLKLISKAQSLDYSYTIVPTLFDQRTRACIQALRTVRDQYGAHVWEYVIPIDTRFRDASLQHLPPSKLAPASRGVMAYRRLLKTLQQTSGH